MRNIWWEKVIREKLSTRSAFALSSCVSPWEPPMMKLILLLPLSIMAESSPESSSLESCRPLGSSATTYSAGESLSAILRHSAVLTRSISAGEGESATFSSGSSSISRSQKRERRFANSETASV